MPHRRLRRFERQDLRWLAVVLCLVLVLAALLAFFTPALLRFIYWLLSHTICFDSCADS
jgi:hypothetical protein